MARHDGDDLPVSAFVGMEDGTHSLGTTKYEKRGIAVYIPEWQMDKWIQCNQLRPLIVLAVETAPIFAQYQEKLLL